MKSVLIIRGYFIFQKQRKLQMRIISKFKDYYDTVQVYGQDLSLIFNRQEKESHVIPGKIKKDEFSQLVVDLFSDFLRIGNRVRSRKKDISGSYFTYTCSPVIFGFCGKYYPILEIDIFLKSSTSEKFYLYSLTEYKNFESEYLQKNKSKNKWGSSFLEQSINMFFLDFKNLENDDVFIDLKIPIFLLKFQNILTTEIQFIENPNLKEKFQGVQKIKPPFEAYSEISQYIGNILTDTSLEDINLTDIQKANNHGFDKWSFRKEPK